MAEFYTLLYNDKELFAKGASLQEKYTSQEELMEAFIKLGKENGFEFTVQDLLDYIYRNGKEVKE